MSAVIHHFVVHQLSVNEQQELTLLPKASCFDISPEIEMLAQQINHAFNQKPGKGVGTFVAEPASDDDGIKEAGFEFKTALQDMLDAPDTFVDFSIASCDKLKKSMIEMASIETGFVIFSHYEFLATEYLMVALLNTKQHVEITDSLELTYSDHLDLAKMQLAVRIDLTQLRVSPEQNRYISFIKGRMGRKVSDFFMHFMGCEELVDVKQQNKQLLKSVDEFIASEQLDKQEQHRTRQIVSEYYKAKLEEGEDINIAELADSLPKESGRDFVQFNQQTETPLEESFQADRSALKTLAKFSGQGGGLSLSFDRVLYGDRIQYDIGTDTLIIKGIPPNLKDQLTRWNG
ncbi:nucleoid-associated protein YejK [Aliiglaciecola sp. LCG003]|uniref:nucleoid-associated protein YejK n=1 Tax=Aliiglaciecola sp. LCG003 TaxID=3053655 RepID=UPI002573C8CB|nr:nucleoid-associated protein YejK [Aliiglaciecola sp. LCG003]WJG10985.1 nucleoid-associated protein YejK [Aliiglaciecola sp. LCG003]